ncbi:uncharacterized protein CMU_042380 [Cryptosporidium muris RN66]|uniref:Uncharacterized protein n=1 Tax=Cryptosporidium muris (strain RN66) TaxID=441375 RepID=B6AAC4_CRYMR|nr:uncharacterized protein CMU_042380 [Cryptosporidium muris RN66]EEA05165.1 hypothetical protein CMU_042380 [Cryptosporidium muris RN66]|eukprot:XP_002139514.1 hypothetical protein [Cryptosporidium muris RN66]
MEKFYLYNLLNEPRFFSELLGSATKGISILSSDYLSQSENEQEQEQKSIQAFPVGLFPNPKSLQLEMNSLSSNLTNNNNEANLENANSEVKSILSGPEQNQMNSKSNQINKDSVNNNQMSNISSGAVSRGSTSEIKTITEDIQLKGIDKPTSPTAKAPGQVVQQGETIKTGISGPVTINQNDNKVQGTTTPPNLVIENNINDKNSIISSFSGNYKIIIITGLILLIILIIIIKIHLNNKK